VFDAVSQTWCFPSHDECVAKNRASSRVPVLPPSKNRRSSPAGLGGPGDPHQRRLLVFVNILRGADALYSLFVHRLATLLSLHCSSDSRPPCEYFVSKGSSVSTCCVVCSRGVVCSMCECGKSLLCFECFRAAAETGASVGKDFAASFPEFAHLIPKGGSGAPVALFVGKVIGLAHDQPDLRSSAPPLELKPPMPPPLPLSNGAATGDACTYDESGYCELGHQLFTASAMRSVQLFSDCAVRRDAPHIRDVSLSLVVPIRGVTARPRSQSFGLSCSTSFGFANAPCAVQVQSRL